MLIGRNGVDLGQLILEQTELAVALGGKLTQAVQPLLQLPRPSKGQRACLQPRDMLIRAQAVEDLQLSGGQRELSMLVLPVERQQRAADLAQLANARRAAVEIGAGAPVRADATREHDLLCVRVQTLTKLLAHALGEVEDPLHIRLACPRTHDPRSGAPSKQQIERSEEHTSELQSQS